MAHQSDCLIEGDGHLVCPSRAFAGRGIFHEAQGPELMVPTLDAPAGAVGDTAPAGKGMAGRTRET
jgi:hypothetical protein